jgi:hypothetical protein
MVFGEAPKSDAGLAFHAKARVLPGKSLHKCMRVVTLLRDRS